MALTPGGKAELTSSRKLSALPAANSLMLLTVSLSVLSCIFMNNYFSNGLSLFFNYGWLQSDLRWRFHLFFGGFSTEHGLAKGLSDDGKIHSPLVLHGVEA